MALPKPPFEGVCLCGSVTVRVTAPPMLTFACHCRDCQKFSAGAYSISTMFPSDSFSCSGELIEGGLHTGARTHRFCGGCLTLIYSQVAGAEHQINVRTSILNNAASFVPFVEVMTDEKLPWVLVPARHSFARHPESADALQAVIAAYARV